MTHPPYGDDEREWGTGGAGREGDDTARPRQPGHQPPVARPPYGPQPHAQPPYGPPPYGQPPYGPPQYGAAGRQYGPPAQPAHGQPPYGPPPQYGQSGFGPPQHGAPGQQYGQFGAPGPYGQAAHGRPGGWGQGPPRRSRRGPTLVLMLLALVAIVAALTALPGLLSSTALDPEAVQRDVAEQFEQLEGVALDLRCDDRMTVETGRSYECQGTTADGEPVTITITIAGEDASYTWSEG